MRPLLTLAVGLLCLAGFGAEPVPEKQDSSRQGDRPTNLAVPPVTNFGASAVAWFVPLRPDPRPYVRHNIPFGNRCRIPIERDIDRLEMGYIVYNRLDRAEFILRRPTPIQDSGGREVAKVLEYSEVREYPARTWILTGSDR